MFLTGTGRDRLRTRHTRTFARVGVAGAGFTLPLLAFGSATAAPAQAGDTVAQHRQTTSVAPAAIYRVVAGDTLSRIAKSQQVQGGWQQLYQRNRDIVGSDPSLIRPGQRLTLPGSPAGASASAALRAAAKPVMAHASRQFPAKTPPRTGSGYVAPVKASVTTRYRVTGSHWASGYHTGVDFAVPTGTALRAIASGTVFSAGWGGAYGNQVVIKLADSRYAQYAHLSSISVRAGQAVAAGQQIGRSGATGNVTGPHLHLEVRKYPGYGSDIDPKAYLAARGVRI
ncbi:peptidoglycan DD-metalloendopeptidase family protein [Streptomyces sp. NPDC056534]|uniref:M23 family metallopeptidase n=1 Tax=Streptomyces sp. NPDC056534 TaxID=3345857 RepID=UPI0036B1F5C7